MGKYLPDVSIIVLISNSYLFLEKILMLMLYNVIICSRCGDVYTFLLLLVASQF